MRGRGRGWYYKQKYGGGGRGGRGRGGSSTGYRGLPREADSSDRSAGDAPAHADNTTAPAAAWGRLASTCVRSAHELQATLQRIDHKSYNAYKDLYGSYDFDWFTLHVDHVQGDAYAEPSHFRCVVPQQMAQFPASILSSKSRRVAAADFVARAFHAQCVQHGDHIRRTGSWHSAKGGDLRIDCPGQHIVERSCATVTNESVELRVSIGLPAQGRTIMGQLAYSLLCESLPQHLRASALYSALDPTALQNHAQVNEDQDALRGQLASLGLVAFVGNGSVLPRASGADDRPLCQGTVIPFQSPPSLEVEVSVPNAGVLRGMGVPHGITVIVGGGFHGKSTLLQALEKGVYNQVPGDGRERVVTDYCAAKIRAEDGRSIANVDISAFINNLPYCKSTTSFSTPDASGSTSQAANIVEALEVGATALLIDEDTSATNFMIRDARMQALVAKEKEPITPFIAKVQALYRTHHVSTILVIGGAGDYFDVANHIIMMDEYVPRDVTEEAKAIAKRFGASSIEVENVFSASRARIPSASSVSAERGHREKIRVRDADAIAFGNEDIDLNAVEQIAEKSQTRAIGAALVYLRKQYMDGRCSIREMSAALERDIEAHGLNVLSPVFAVNHARPRRFEIAAALNRLRSLQVEQA